jgi:hypothetical protein
MEHPMNTLPITKALTQIVVVAIFWGVLLLSLLLRENFDLWSILFDLGKALTVSGAAWFFLTILNDTLIKSMVLSAKESKYDRYNGGLSYHLTNATKEERSWQKQFRANNEEYVEEWWKEHAKS